MIVSNKWLLAISLLAIVAICVSYLLYRRKVTASSILRFLAATAVVASFGGIRLEIERNIRLAVYILDISGSYSPDRLSAVEVIRTHALSLNPPARAAFVTFGTEAALEGPVESAGFSVALDSGAGLGREATNVEAALRAVSTLGGRTDRAYMFSDGRANAGETAKGALLCSQAGIRVYPVMLKTLVPADAWVSNVETPGSVAAGELFKVFVHAGSNRAGAVNITLAAGAERLKKVVELAGTGELQRVEFSLSMDEPGIIPLVAEVGAPGFTDSYPANNAARGGVRVLGQRRIVVFTQNADSAAVQLLKGGERFSVVAKRPEEIPETPGRLQGAAVVIVDNVSARGLTPGQMDSLKRYVRDLGGGFLVLGGPDSYGPGGYIETALEEALPLWCNPENRKKASLVFVLDASGSMGQKTDFMGEGLISKFRAALKAIVPVYRELKKGDKVAIISFNTSPTVELLLTADDDGSVLKGVLTGGLTKKRPAGKTNIYPALRQAMEVIKTGGREEQQNRTCHIVLLSDGVQTIEDSIDLEEFKKAGISVSAVATGATPDRKRLKEIADKTGGEYYEVSRFDSALRRIFVEDVRRNLSELVRSGEIEVKKEGQAEFLKGVERFPRLQGLVLTKAKDQAHVAALTDKKEPVLAWWRLGLGRVIAFTGALDSNWGGEWLGWEELPGIVRRAVGWLCTDNQNPDFTLSTVVEGGTVRAGLVVREGGKLVDGLKLKAVFSCAQEDPVETEFRQTGPGEYEAGAGVTPESLCVISVFRENGEVVASTETWVAGSLEYGIPGYDVDALSSLAALTGGEVLSEDAFLSDLPEGKGGRGYGLWWVLLILAGCFFLADIAQSSLFSARRLR